MNYAEALVADANCRHRWSVIRGGLLALLVLTVSSGSVAAQQIRGTVSDAGSGDPIPSVQVWLQTADGEDQRLTFTAEDGSFAIEPDSAGHYRIEARRQGYESTTSESFEWPDDSDPIELRMSVRPVEIEGVEVEGQSDIRLEHQATYAGLHRRALDTPPVGRERVYLRDELEHHDSRTIAEYVRRMNVPGIGRRCSPGIVWAGFEAPFGVPRDIKPVYLSMKVRDMEAIEMYGTRPPVGLAVSGPGCGVVVLWPRRANLDPGGGRR